MKKANTRLRHIKKHLERGDQKQIAELSGYSHVYTRQVLTGQRNCEKILKVAEQLITNRQELKELCKSIHTEAVTDIKN